MAPGYRNSNPSRRQNRGLVDHDIMEGLPVRNWRRDTVTVAPPPVHDPFASAKDKWDVELPWGMPKDAHLMPQHSQDLLRAARSGRIYQKRLLVEEEDVEADALIAEKTEKKEGEAKEEGFVVRTWKLVPKHLEGPEIEFLAKRRKGLRGAVVKGVVPVGPTMTKMTLRRTDEAGNTYVEDVVVPEGHVVEGEVIAKTVISDPATTGVATESLAPPQPIKRRPPPPKRKAKGPGRGRRKKLPLPPTSAPANTGAAPVHGQIQEVQKQEPAVDANGIKIEATTTPTNENEDTEMGDGSIIHSDDEGEDADDASEDEDPEGEHEGSQINDHDRDRDHDDNNRDDHMVLDHLPTSPKLAPPKPAISGDFPVETPLGEFSGHGGSHGATSTTSGSPLKHAFTPQSYSPTLSAVEALPGIIGVAGGEGVGVAEHEGALIPADALGGQGQRLQDEQFAQHQQPLHHDVEQHLYEVQEQQEQQQQQQHPDLETHAAAPQMSQEHSPADFDVSTTDFAGLLSGETMHGFGEGGEEMLLDGVGVEEQQHEQHEHDLPDLTAFDDNAVGAVGAVGEGMMGGEGTEQQGGGEGEKFEDLLGSLEEHLDGGMQGEGEGIVEQGVEAAVAGEEKSAEDVTAADEGPAEVTVVEERREKPNADADADAGQTGDVAMEEAEKQSVDEGREEEGGAGAEGMDTDTGNAGEEGGVVGDQGAAGPAPDALGVDVAETVAESVVSEATEAAEGIDVAVVDAGEVPTVEVPAVEESAAEVPSAEEPTVEAPAAKAPSADSRPVKEHTTEASAVDPPAVGELARDEVKTETTDATNEVKKETNDEPPQPPQQEPKTEDVPEKDAVKSEA